MNPHISDADILGLALGAPARQVLNHAQLQGPKTGWKDGYLSSDHGLCPSNPDQTHNCLRRSLGNVWLQACTRLPALVPRGKVRQSISALPVVSGTSDTVPDQALWAACTCLNILGAAFRYEARRDGHHSNLAVEGDLELPRALSVPLEQISKRLGRAQPYLIPYDVAICNYRLRNGPYPINRDDLDLMFPIFGNEEERQSLLWMARLHITFSPAIDLMAQCQEEMLHHDEKALTRALVALTQVIKNLVPILRDLPAEALSTYRTCVASCAPPVDDSMPHPELSLPVFQLLDAFVGTRAQNNAIGDQTTAQRLTLPVNIRAFAAAVESRPVSTFVEKSVHPQLRYAWGALVQAYSCRNGLRGLHEQKAIASQHLAARTGQLPHFVSGDGADNSPPWEGGERNVSKSTSMEAFEHCVVRAKVTARSRVDGDPDRSTALVSLLIQEPHGLFFEPGDRLLAMPLNSWTEVEKMAAALGLDNCLDQEVPLYGGTHWDKFSRQLHPRSHQEPSRLLVQDVLRYGQIAPLSKTQITALDKMFHGTCSLITHLLESTTWPLKGTLGDVLQIAIEQVSPVIWDTVFDLSRLSWLPDMIPVAEPRPYGISNPALMGTSLPSTIKITVGRTTYEVDPNLDDGLEATGRSGMTSRALNPHPEEIDEQGDDNEYPFMIGIAPASHLRLQSTPMDNIVMFADASSVGIFRSYWRSRSSSVGKTLLFLALQTATKYPFEAELKQLEHHGQIRVFTSFASETDPLDEDRLLSSAILDQGQYVCDLLTSTSDGGLGAHFYLSGCLKLYQSVIAGVRRALYNSDFVLAGKSADDLMATAANEGRLMLDIYSEPSRPLDVSRQISLAELASRTGHRMSTKLWLAISGNVYDLTTMQQLWPADALAIRLNAGLDATKQLSTLMTSAPALRNLLPDFFVGRLKHRQVFSSTDNQNLFELWTSYLRAAVETLTALAYETEILLRGSAEWFTTATGRESLRSFLQTHARLFRSGVSSMFGVMLQELHVRTAFALVSKSRPDMRIPDVMGDIARARSSRSVATAVKELQVLESLSRSSRLTQVQASTAIQYVQAVTELELHLLESVRDDVRGGVQALEHSPDIDEHVTSGLLSVLEHVAHRYQAFWERLALESVGRSCMRKTLLRKKYDIIQRPLQLGGVAAAVLAHPAIPVKHTSPVMPTHFMDHTVNFAHLVDQAMQTVNEENLMAAYTDNRSRGQSSRTEHHVAQSAVYGPTEPTAYDAFHRRRAVRALASFLGSSETAIKRLSQLPADLSFAYIMATYGRSATGIGSHTRSSSAARSVLRTMDSQAGHDTPRPRLIRRRTNTSSISSPTPQSIFSSPEAGTPDTRASISSSPMPLQLTLRSRDRSASKASAPPARQSKGSLSSAPVQETASVPFRSSGRKQSIGIPSVALAPALISGVANDEPPTNGTKLPALMPSPRLPEREVMTEEPARTRHWGMPLVSLSKVERQTTHKHGVGIPPPAIPLQTVHQPPAPSVSPTPAPLEIDWFSQKLTKQILKCTFSAKELPIVTLSKKVKPTRKQHWEMPLISLSKVERQTTYKRGAGIPPSILPLQIVHQSPAPSVSLTPAPPKSDWFSQKPTKQMRKGTFSAKELPIVTLSKNAKRVDQRGGVAQRKQFWEMPLYTLSMAELRTGSTTAARLPAVPLQRAIVPPSAKPASQEAALGMEAPVRPVVPFTARQLPILTLSNSERNQKNHPSGNSTQIARLAVSTSRAASRISSKAPKPATYSFGSRGLWRSPDELHVQEQLALRNGCTLGYVGLWMLPASRIINRDFLGNLAETSSTSQVAHRKAKIDNLQAMPSKGFLWGNAASKKYMNLEKTRGYVGLWMDPPSKKQNDDFALVRQGKTIPQPNVPAAKLAPTMVRREAVMPSAGLWQGGRNKRMSSRGRTAGFVGMWMKPASRIRNADFEEFRAETSRLGFSPARKASTSAPPNSLHSFQTKQMWSAKTEPASAPLSHTVGSVGMWMFPASQKVNLDFEQLLANTVNYLLGSSSTMHSRMAKDMSLVATELHEGPWGLTDWTLPSRTKRGPQPIALLTEAQTPVQPQRSYKPVSYTDRTLGQVGMWMYPPSKRRNLDFEGFRAATEAAPELETKLIPRQVRRKKSISSPKSRRSTPVGRTTGFVGLWMDPPSRKVNADFEWAKDHAETSMKMQPTNPMLPPPIEAIQVETAQESPESEPILIIQHPEPANYAFLAESPSLSTIHTATMTPISASTTDGLARHNIDFEERLKRLNAELEMEDSGIEDDSAVSTPTIVTAPPPAPLKTNLPMSEQSTWQSPGRGRWGAPHSEQSPQDARPTTELSEGSRRPELERIKVDSPRLLNQEGLEVLSAARYTPDSASSGSSVTLLSPASAARPVRPRPAKHLWEREIGPSPSELPPAPPLRTQSTRQPSSRVSSVKNMWEKRASLMLDQPPRISRSSSRSPPEPLRLQRANTTATGANGRRDARRDERRDSPTNRGYELAGGQGFDVNAQVMSPMSPSVRAY